MNKLSIKFVLALLCAAFSMSSFATVYTDVPDKTPECLAKVPSTALSGVDGSPTKFLIKAADFDALAECSFGALGAGWVRARATTQQGMEEQTRLDDRLVALKRRFPDFHEMIEKASLSKYDNVVIGTDGSIEPTYFKRVGDRTKPDQRSGLEYIWLEGKIYTRSPPFPDL